MFQPANLDPREQSIYDEANQFWATRFHGRGHYDRIGPFESQEVVVAAINSIFGGEKQEDLGPVFNRPFAVYASSPRFGSAHVIIGNVYRDGVARPTHREVSQKRQEERASARRSRPRRNRTGDL